MNINNLNNSIMTREEMIWTTIAALNDGSKEAMEEAAEIRQMAIDMGDDELYKQIQYYWEVI